IVYSTAFLSIPTPIVALPCGSRSTSSTRRCVAAREAARFTQVVVLPTPPFWFATAITFAIRLPPQSTPFQHHDSAAPGARRQADLERTETELRGRGPPLLLEAR